MKKVLIYMFILFTLLIPARVLADDGTNCNHIIVIDKGYAPTCYDDGLSDGKHCELCWEVIQEQVVLKAGHNGKRIAAAAPTCTIPGQTEGMYCFECKKIYEGGEIIPATGHKFKTIPEVKATCTKDGTTSGKKCTVCGWNAIQQKVIPASHYGGTKTVITKATTTKDGSIKKHCKTCDETLSTKKIYRIKEIKLLTPIYNYDGGRKSPVVTITDSKGEPIKSNQYTVSYTTNCKNVGKHTVKVKFKGNYKGTESVIFTIKPKNTTFKSVIKRKHSLTLKWRKVSKQVTGYEIRFSSNKKFTKKTTKYLKVKNFKTTERTIRQLKSKKTYYAKIRTYKIVNGKTYYSSWSNVVKMKTL